LAIKNENTATKLVEFLVFVSFCFALLAFTAGSTDNLRRSGIELNPTLHSKMLFFSTLLLIAKSKSGLHSRKLILLTVLALAACVATGSRGAIVVVLLCLILDKLVALRVGELVNLLKYSTLILLAVPALLIFAPAEISSRFSLESLSDQNKEGDRLFLFSFAIDLIAKNPFGIGMGNMSDYFWVAAPHNIFLEAVLDLGWIVALPYLILLVATFIRSIQFLRSGNFVLRFFSLWFVFMFFNSMIGGEMAFPSLMLYMSMGCIWLVHFSDEKNIGERQTHFFGRLNAST
jgi:hypothetical protein